MGKLNLANSYVFTKNGFNSFNVQMAGSLSFLDTSHTKSLEGSEQQELNPFLELQRLQNQYNNLCDFIPVGYFILNEAGMIMEINKEGINLLGFSKNIILNQNLTRYIVPEFQNTFVQHCGEVLKGTTIQTCNIELVRKDRSSFHAQVRTKAVLTADNRKILLISVQDISLNKKYEDLLAKQQTFVSALNNNSVTHLASTIAHEIKHPLAIVLNYLYGCIRRLECNHHDTHEIINALKTATKQTHKVSEIILRMKNLHCLQEIDLRPLHVNKIIEEIIAQNNHNTQLASLKIKCLFTKELPKVLIDKYCIEQAINNIINNSIEAMRDENTPKPRICIETNYINQEFIQISISDNGPGIAADYSAKLFTPYFTTKSYGVGLGLVITKSIIDAHGGQISAELNPAGGTVFKFTLRTAS